MGLDNNEVSVALTGLRHYPSKSPFHPPERYPEYRGTEVAPENHVYAGVRDTLASLGLDAENFGSPAWNPFHEVVKPGMTVFIKPNTVRHYHLAGKDVLSVIIHASVLRPVLDYVCIALNGRGRIIIGDSQVTEGEFDKALVASQFDKLLDWYRQQTEVSIECIDLRINRSIRTWMYGKWGRKRIEQDPRGYTFVDLGDDSYFRDIDPKRLRIAIASYKEMYRHHSKGRHEYLFPNSVLESDAVINIAKLKTHRRTAITVAIKNFMGLPALKDSLPHFITGAPSEGGDQYIHPSWRKRVCTMLHDQIQTVPWIPAKFVYAVTKKLLWNSHKIVPFKDDIYEAMWYGNDTLWRTLLDLNRAALYSDRKGKLCDTPQRTYLCIVDGIIGGEKDGPVSPDPVPAGVLLAGHNPVAVDCVASTLMGFDLAKIPLVQKGLEDSTHSRPIFRGERSDVCARVGNRDLSIEQLQQEYDLHFEPHPNWKGHVELSRPIPEDITGESTSGICTTHT